MVHVTTALRPHGGYDYNQPIDMNTRIALAALISFASLAGAEEVSLFNGKDLTGWEGRADLWSVKDGCITGQTQPDAANPGKSTLKSNTFLIWKDGEVGANDLAGIRRMYHKSRSDHWPRGKSCGILSADGEKCGHKEPPTPPAGPGLTARTCRFWTKRFSCSPC